MASLEWLFEAKSIDELDSKAIREILSTKKGTPDLQSLTLKDPQRAVELSIKAECPLALLLKGEKSESSSVIDVLLWKLKHAESDAELEVSVDTLSLLLSSKGYSANEAEAIISKCAPRVADLEKCWVALVRVYKSYGSDTLILIDQQIDILNARENYANIFKIVATVFEMNREDGKALFGIDAVQESIKSVSQYSSSPTIKEGLCLLSALCSDEQLRKLIAANYTTVLVHALKMDSPELRELSALVIVKTWSFSQIELEKSLSVGDLYDILTKNFTKHTIEGLAYLSIKPSVKQKLRGDDEIMLDLTKSLDPESKTPLEDIYGILVILANLTAIEEESEVSDLKKHAQKGLESEQEDSVEVIEAFQEDLLERNVVHSISAHSKFSLPSVFQAICLIYNLSKGKNNRPQILSQAGLEILIRSVTVDNIPADKLQLAYQAISNLLLTTNPASVFRLREAQFSLFQYLMTEDISQKHQLQAIISLTNANAVDNGAITDNQWAIIDHYLNNEETLIRRAAIELVCNIVQHKDNVEALFNFGKSSSKKRYDLLVQYTLLPDLKSQCSAVAALSFGVTFPFIAEEVIKDNNLLDNLFSLLNEQHEEEDLLERVLYVLYNLVFNAEENTAVMESLAKKEQFKHGIQAIIKTAKRGSTLFEMALEIAKMVRFK